MPLLHTAVAAKAGPGADKVTGMLSILPMALALEMTDAIIVVRRGGTDKSLYAMLLSVARVRSTLAAAVVVPSPPPEALFLDFSLTFPGFFLRFSRVFGEARGAVGPPRSGRVGPLS